MMPNDRLNRILLVVMVLAFFLAPIFQDNLPLFVLWMSVGLITLSVMVGRMIYYRFGVWYLLPFLPIPFVIAFLVFNLYREKIFSWLCW
jgi:hypothetical protein